jgi:4-hydroxybenzoate polyprenyltransferase
MADSIGQRTVTGGRKSQLPLLWASARPRQWVKNLLVFAGLVFAQKMGDFSADLRALQAFLIFCLLSSAVYLLNDVLDREQDRLHPLKKNRPVASGALSPGLCVRASLLCAAAGIAWSLALGGAAFTAVGSSYLALSFLYSWRLKRVVIIDVMALGLGFVLRVVGGTVAIAVPTSHWILLCTFLLSLFLGFGKRRHELTLLEDLAPGHRSVLVHYSPYFLDQMIAIVTTSTLICYVLYTLSAETASHTGTPNLIYTVPFVMYGIFRYLYLIHQRQSGGDPAHLLLTDHSLLVAVSGWLASALVLLYF